MKTQPYLEGNTYNINGKDQIYQPDGTFRDATIVEPPMPPDYVDPNAPVDNRTEFEKGSGISGYDAALAKEKAQPRNSQGLTAQQMADYANGKIDLQGNPIVASGGIKYNPDGSRQVVDEKTELDNYYAGLKPKTQEEIDAENERIREDNYKNQQLAIDSINNMYTNILNQIGVANQDRLGSTATMQALTGERGSKSGGADVKKTEDLNLSITKAAEAERANKIAAIMSDYETKIDTALETARKARETDANAWIKYQEDKIANSKTESAALRSSFISAGIKDTDIDDVTWQKIADAGGYTIEQAKTLYKSDYDAKQAAFLANERKAQLETKKAELANAKTEADVKKVLAEANATDNEKENMMIDNGYIYMSTPQVRDQYANQGRIMVTVNGRTYMAPKEKVDKASGSSSTKNYTATTIPADIKAELLADVSANMDMNEVMTLYPEVSTQYVQQLYGIGVNDY